MKVQIIQSSQTNGMGKVLKAKKLWITGTTLPYLAALTPNDIHVDIKNELVEDVDFNCDHDLIAITTMGCSVARAFEIADKFRERGKKVVMGGIPVTLTPEIALEHADAVVVGEAEHVWETLLRDFEKGKLQQTYQSDTLCDLRKIPSPRYEMLDKNLYAPIRPIEATRGCPHKCYYCSPAHVYKGVHRVRAIDDVILDVETIKKSGIRRILFVDDSIDGNRKYFKELLRELIPQKIKWFSQATVNAARDAEIVDLMAQSGCEMLSIGFESINQNSLQSVRKNHNTVKDYKDIVNTLRKKGISVNALIMLGFDHDDESIFEETFHMFEEMGVSLPELFILVPPLGTDLFREFEEGGRLLHKDWSRYKVTEVVFQPKQMSPETLQNGFWETYDRFYSFPSIFKRMFLKNTASLLSRRVFRQTLLVLYFNLKYRKTIMQDRVHPGVI